MVATKSDPMEPVNTSLFMQETTRYPGRGSCRGFARASFRGRL